MLGSDVLTPLTYRVQTYNRYIEAYLVGTQKRRICSLYRLFFAVVPAVVGLVALAPVLALIGYGDCYSLSKRSEYD